MSTDPIISSHIGPNIFRFDLAALIRRLRSRPDPAARVAERFLDLFEQHGVGPTKISHFIPALTLDKIRAPETLIPALFKEILDHAAALFGIQRSWLDGIDDLIYPHRTCYKSLAPFSTIWLPEARCRTRSSMHSVSVYNV